MLIKRDRESELLEKKCKQTEDCFAKAEEALKLAREAAADLKLRLQEAEQTATKERELREEAERARVAAEEEAEKLKRALKDAQYSLSAAKKVAEDAEAKHLAKLKEEKAKARQHLVDELAKKDKAHAEAMVAALAESTLKVKAETEQEYSEQVWDTLSKYLPAFQPGFNYPAFKAYAEAQIQADLDNLAALEVAAAGGMPSDPRQ